MPSLPTNLPLQIQMDPFPLLALPPEIREEIYRVVLAPHRPIRPRRFGPSQTALLRTCRQIYAEAAQVLYSSPIKLVDHGDYFTGAEFVLLWLLRIGGENRARLRRVELDFAWAYAWRMECRGGFQSITQQAYRFPCLFGFGRIRGVAENMVAHLEEGNAGYVERCLRLVAGGCQELRELRVLLPGSSKGSNDREPGLGYGMFNSYPVIRKTLGRVRGLKRLTIGYTLDLEVVDRMAEKMGVAEVEVQWRSRDWNEMFDCRKVDPSKKKTPRSTEYKSIQDAVTTWRNSGWKLPSTISQDDAGSAFKTFSRSSAV